MDKWMALESNPEVLTKFAHTVGVEKQWEVADVFGLDPELLAFVPQPVVAVILLFPSRGHSRAETPAAEGLDGAFYMDQTEELPNACGTIAMMHAILNNRDLLGLKSDSILGKYFESTKVATPLERAVALDSDESVKEMHNSLVCEGQTEAVASEGVKHHFVCFTAVDRQIVEFDGAYQSAPLSHGPMESGEDTLQAAARVIKKVYIDGGDGGIDFSMMALAMKAE